MKRFLTIAPSLQNKINIKKEKQIYCLCICNSLFPLIWIFLIMIEIQNIFVNIITCLFFIFTCINLLNSWCGYSIKFWKRECIMSFFGILGFAISFYIAAHCNYHLFGISYFFNILALLSSNHLLYCWVFEITVNSVIECDLSYFSTNRNRNQNRNQI